MTLTFNEVGVVADHRECRARIFIRITMHLQLLLKEILPLLAQVKVSNLLSHASHQNRDGVCCNNNSNFIHLIQ